MTIGTKIYLAIYVGSSLRCECYTFTLPHLCVNISYQISLGKDPTDSVFGFSSLNEKTITS